MILEVRGLLQICFYLLVHMSDVLGDFLCNPSELHSKCMGNQMHCVQIGINKGECRCKDGYVINQATNGTLNCIDANTAGPAGGSAGHSATVAVVVVFTIALLATALFLVVRRYNLLHWLQQKINARRNNEVQYEDVMIGQDDPPLAP